MHKDPLIIWGKRFQGGAGTIDREMKRRWNKVYVHDTLAIAPSKYSSHLDDFQELKSPPRIAKNTDPDEPVSRDWAGVGRRRQCKNTIGRESSPL